MTMKLGLWIVTTFILSIGLVVGLWALSKDIRDQPGSFLRQYPPHPILKPKFIKLPDEPYYFAGAATGKIYLANARRPFDILEISSDLTDTSLVHLDIGVKRLPYIRITVTVDSPYFYLMDGAIPYMFRGNIENWKGEPYMKDSIYFIDALPISYRSFAISALSSSKRREKTLGKMIVNEEIQLNHDLLEVQLDGVFDVDGSITYDKKLRRIVYVYYYRNQYIVMDTNLNLDYRGNTIDTFEIAQVKSAEVSSEKAIKLAAPPIITNKSQAVYGPWLFIHSLLPAKNEAMKSFENASVIDVYNLSTSTYQFSFYMFDDDGEKMKEFIVANRKLYALYKHSIWSFDLTEKFFPTQIDVTAQ